MIKFTSHAKEVLARARDAELDALDKMGDFAVMKAQDYATVDTGNMRASITHENVDDHTERYGTSNDKAPIKPVNYAPFVELGTVRMRPQPFIRPAVENHMQELRAIAETALKEGMDG